MSEVYFSMRNKSLVIFACAAKKRGKKRGRKPIENVRPPLMGRARRSRFGYLSNSASAARAASAILPQAAQALSARRAQGPNPSGLAG